MTKETDLYTDLVLNRCWKDNKVNGKIVRVLN
jgi:hypothetical protein